MIQCFVSEKSLIPTLVRKHQSLLNRNTKKQTMPSRRHSIRKSSLAFGATSIFLGNFYYDCSLQQFIEWILGFIGLGKLDFISSLYIF